MWKIFFFQNLKSPITWPIFNILTSSFLQSLSFMEMKIISKKIFNLFLENKYFFSLQGIYFFQRGPRGGHNGKNLYFMLFSQYLYWNIKCRWISNPKKIFWIQLYSVIESAGHYGPPPWTIGLRYKPSWLKDWPLTSLKLQFSKCVFQKLL